jgi:hypothetical protein
MKTFTKRLEFKKKGVYNQNKIFGLGKLIGFVYDKLFVVKFSP